MELIQNNIDDTNLINSVSETELIINDKSYLQSLILSNHQIVTDIDVNSIEKLTEEHVQQLLQTKPDLIIFGTGTAQLFPGTLLLAPIATQNIGFEIMNNKSASRTYNVLVTEERKVACLLIL